MADRITFDFSAFTAQLRQLEQLGANTDAIARAVVDAGVEAGLPAWRREIPRGRRPNPQGHAQDNVVAGPLKTGKAGTKYRILGFNGDRSYLYMIDRGTSRVKKHPWRSRANRAVQAAAQPAMEKALAEEINKRLK